MLVIRSKEAGSCRSKFTLSFECSFVSKKNHLQFEKNSGIISREAIRAFVFYDTRRLFMALTYREKKKKMICKIFQNNSPKNDLREISSIINDYLRSILASNEIIISIRFADERRNVWHYCDDIRPISTCRVSRNFAVASFIITRNRISISYF